jgi:hypothetical protein
MTLNQEGREVAREILDHLGTAREPVREDVLHERMALSVDPARFIGVLEQLLSTGQVGMHVDHDPPVTLPRPKDPFGFRFWYPTPH